jgi:hypothetical protein
VRNAELEPLSRGLRGSDGCLVSLGSLVVVARSRVGFYWSPIN